MSFYHDYHLEYKYEFLKLKPREELLAAILNEPTDFGGNYHDLLS